MSFIKKPMLAANADPTKLDFSMGFLATPKIDGIRCLVIGDGKPGRVLSRTFKPIPNTFIRMTLGMLPGGVDFDGEITVGKTFQDSTSGVMTEGLAAIDFAYHVFDVVTNASRIYDSYARRVDDLRQILTTAYRAVVPYNLHVVQPVLLMSYEAFERYEEKCLRKGYEGVILRRSFSHYKFGRSTLQEEGLLKVKRLCDAEGEIIGFKERMANDNESVPNALGYKKKSSMRSGLRPVGTLGTLVLQDLVTKKRVNIGTGFSDWQRDKYWENRSELLGRIVKYRFQPIGVKDKPRCASFLGFRSKLDL